MRFDRRLEELLSDFAGRRGMLDEGQDSVGHEASSADRSAASRHLDDFDDATAGVDLHPPTIAGRNDVVRADFAARIDHR